jgi:hypothetical protein
VSFIFLLSYSKSGLAEFFLAFGHFGFTNIFNGAMAGYNSAPGESRNSVI